MNEFTIESEGFLLDARRYGEKGGTGRPGVVLAHGLASSKDEYFDWPERLAELGLVVITFDFRGHGRSSGQRAYLTSRGHLADLRCAVEALLRDPSVDPERFALVGHSLGCVPVTRAAAAEPRPQCIVLMSPPATVRAEMSLVERGAAMALYLLARPINRITGRHVYFPYKADPEQLFFDPAAREQAASLGIPEKWLSILSYPYLVEDIDLVRDAGNVAVPALVLASTDDRLVPVERSRSVYQAMPEGTEWFEVTGGHSVMGDVSGSAAFDEVSAFLTGHLLQRSGAQAS